MFSSCHCCIVGAAVTTCGYDTHQGNPLQLICTFWDCFLGVILVCACVCVCICACMHVCVCVCAHACVCAVEFLLLKSVGARGLCKCLGLLQIRCVKCLLLLLLYLLTSLSPHLDPSVVYLEAMVWEWSE